MTKTYELTDIEAKIIDNLRKPLAQRRQEQEAQKEKIAVERAKREEELAKRKKEV